MLFSIVVALYNKAAYIEGTLRAVLSQSFDDFEIIVVNDGSTDASAEVVRAIGDKRIRLAEQANAGVAAARNHGISLAQGTWVAFLDADDAWSKDYLQTQAQSIRLHPEVDLVATGFHQTRNLPQWLSNGGPAMPGPESVELVSDLPGNWLSRTMFFTSSVAVRTSCLMAMQPCFAVGESVGEDLDLWFRLGERKKVAFVPTQLAGYRIAVPGSLTSNRALDILPPYLARMAKRAKSGEMSPEQARSALQFIWNDQINVARHCIQVRRRNTAARWIVRTAPGGVLQVRWWVTLAMLAVPSSLVGMWTQWRFRRGGSFIDET